MRQLTPAVFSTAGLPEQRRVELWEDHNADALIGLRCRTLTAASLEATEINLQLDQIHLARVRGNSHVVERDQALVRRRPAGSIALFFSLAGEAFFYHDDGVRTVRPGEMLMCDADRPFMRGFSQGLEELVVKVPRQVFAEVTGIEHVPSPAVVGFARGGNPFAHALARQVGAAARSEDPRPAREQDLLDLIAALAGRSPAGGHRAAAQAHIDSNFADPALSAARVAAAVGLSTRHLSRVFAESGISVPQYILSRRLEAARRMLAGPVPIAEVAHRCGFASPAHFSHAFRAHFGERASDLRRSAIASRSGRDEPHS
ncbi:helix-turn-helix domain-containing protein [Actinoplanes sp. NPDC051633]|uniref:helix-turn-helix domain-containing protein n=1 Tax=Actinoplanes sp. NPDC051633 TaxID=3155670 RepID=UPI00344831E6